MLGSTFYHQTIRKYVAAFGTLFNDLNIERKKITVFDPIALAKRFN